MKTRVLAALMGLTILGSAFAGCGSGKDSDLIEILKILPDDVLQIDHIDNASIIEEPELGFLQRYVTLGGGVETQLGIEDSSIHTITLASRGVFGMSSMAAQSLKKSASSGRL